MSASSVTPSIQRGFTQAVVRWQQQHGRHHLPWQATQDAYRIWLAEIMLQQTQVSAVINYYQRFLTRFPNLAALAHATEDEVMPYWAGLGYYARARNLHRCAQTLVREHDGRFPSTAQQIMTLPGIGRSTAGAIAAFAYGERSPILDGNVRRVFCRYFGITGIVNLPNTQRLLWKTAENLLHSAPGTLDMTAYTQGLMDLGATVCTRGTPNCPACPLARDCYARNTGTQAQLPETKPRKSTPERSCVMLILRHKGCVLLQQRPAPGIWGKLWSLPQYDDETAMVKDCHLRGASTAHITRLAGLRHVFTHFKLFIQPWLLDVTTHASTLTRRPTERWQAFHTLSDAALPAPIRKLLQATYCR